MKEQDTATSGLDIGIFDILDARLGLQNYFNKLNTTSSTSDSKCILALDYRWHDLNYNHYDPRWGMNPHDPFELYPDNRDNSIDPLSITIALLIVAFTLLGLWHVFTKGSWRKKDSYMEHIQKMSKEDQSRP